MAYKPLEYFEENRDFSSRIDHDTVDYEQLAYGLTVVPVDITFGNASLNEVAAAHTITVFNTGVRAIPIIGITVTGDYLVSASVPMEEDVPYSLAPGSMISLSCTFRPTTEGIHIGKIVLDTGVDVLGDYPVTLVGYCISEDI